MGDSLNFKEAIKNYIRVLKISKKPDKEEFMAAAKITGIGMLLIGMIGFIIFLVFQIFK